MSGGQFEGDMSVVDQRNVLLVLVIDKNGVATLTPGVDDDGDAVIDREQALNLLTGYVVESRKANG